MVKSAVVRHMSSVEDYRARLASLQGSWDTLSLLSHLRGDGADVSGTRQAFESLANDLIDELYLTVYPLSLGGGKRVFPEGVDVPLRLESAKPYPTGVLGLHYLRESRQPRS